MTILHCAQPFATDALQILTVSATKKLGNSIFTYFEILPTLHQTYTQTQYNFNSNNNNNNNNIYLLQLGCHPVAVVILHVYKT